MKDELYWKILDSVVRLEVVKGHLRWKITDVSRIAGVQRTLIYYYFGKSKENILKSALKIIGDEFFGLSPERLELWKSGQIRESILQTRALIQKAPHIPEFFFHWRHQKSSVQTELIALEKRYLNKLKTHFPQLKESDKQAFYGIVLGLVLLPELSEAALDRILRDIPIMMKRA